MPPSLISVPRPGTTVVEKPLAVTTRTGISTGSRRQRRVLEASVIHKILPSNELLFKLPRDSKVADSRTRGRIYGLYLLKFDGFAGTGLGIFLITMQPVSCFRNALTLT